MMKFFYTIILSIWVILSNAQFDVNLKTTPDRDADSTFFQVFPENNNHRGRALNKHNVAAILAPLIEDIIGEGGSGKFDTAYIQGDSLVIVMQDDTIYFEGGGAISDGDKGDITVSSSGSVWDIDPNTITPIELIDIGVTAGTYDYPSLIKVNSKGLVTEILGADDPALNDEHVFYKYGTSLHAVEADDSIETTNEKYILFKGLDGGLNQKIELLKEGTIRFDHEEAATKVYQEVKSLQQLVNNPSWKWGIENSASIYADQNNSILWYNMYNMEPGGGVIDSSQVAFGSSEEANYIFSESDTVIEKHWHIKPIGGSLIRPESWVMDVRDPKTWYMSCQIQNFNLRETTDGIDYYFRVENNDASAQMFLLSPISNKGLQLQVEPSSNYAQLLPYGTMTNPQFYLSSWYQVGVNRLTINTPMGTADKILGIETGPQWVSEIDEGYGLTLSSGVLRVDTTQLATQYDLTTVSGTKPALKFSWDGNGGVLGTGNTIYTVLEYACTITGWSIVATGSSPTATIDVWRATGTSLPTVANTIMGIKPALSTGNAVRSSTLTGWNPVALSAGDIIGVNIDAVSAATWMQFKIEVQ